MSDTLETIKEEPIIQKKKGRPFKTITNEEPFVPKKRGRPLKAPLNTDYVPKPAGRPKKTPEEIKQYHKDYYEANKERIKQKRIEYRSTPNYKVLRHMQNQRYKERQAQKPKVCLIKI